MKIGDRVRYIDVFNADHYQRLCRRIGTVESVDEGRLLVTVNFGAGEKLTAMPFSFERVIDLTPPPPPPMPFLQISLGADYPERAASWVRRNMREWPYRKKLTFIARDKTVDCFFEDDGSK